MQLAIAANDHDHEKEQNQPAQMQSIKAEQSEIANQGSLPSISVKYELQNSIQKMDWFMDRKPKSIATFNAASQQGEVWSINTYGDIEHNRVFVQDKTIVDYTNGQLKTLNKVPQWNQLASIYSPKQIAKLNKTGEKILFGKSVTVHEGVLNGLPTVIWWMPEMQIPAYVQQGDGKARKSMMMVEMRTETPSTWSWVNPTALVNYARIDASDFGDMESDPFVKKLLELEGHHH
jgi:hypothetical protein